MLAGLGTGKNLLSLSNAARLTAKLPASTGSSKKRSALKLRLIIALRRLAIVWGRVIVFVGSNKTAPAFLRRPRLAFFVVALQLSANQSRKHHPPTLVLHHSSEFYKPF